MKKILIFSLCALFSLDGALYGTGVAAPQSKVLWNFSVPVRLRADERLLAPIDDANVLASVEEALQDAVCWRDARLIATLGNNFLWLEFVEKRLLFNTETKQIQELGPAQEEVFTQVFTQRCKSKGRVTVAAIADATGKDRNNVYKYISGGSCDSLEGTGMKISSVGGGIQTNMGAVSIEPPDSTRTVRIPLTGMGNITGPSETAEILMYENVNKVHAPGSRCPSKISCFIDINGKLQRVGYCEACLLAYLGKCELNTPITTGNIIAQTTVNGEKVFAEDTVYPNICRVRPLLKTCGLKIIKEEKGYKIQVDRYSWLAKSLQSIVDKTAGEPHKEPARTQGDCESNPFGGYSWLAESIQKAL